MSADAIRAQEQLDQLASRGHSIPPRELQGIADGYPPFKGGTILEPTELRAALDAGTVPTQHRLYVEAQTQIYEAYGRSLTNNFSSNVGSPAATPDAFGPLLNPTYRA